MKSKTTLKKTLLVIPFVLAILITAIIWFVRTTTEPVEPVYVECSKLMYTFRGGLPHYFYYCYDDIENYSKLHQSVIKQWKEQHVELDYGNYCKDHICLIDNVYLRLDDSR